MDIKALIKEVQKIAPNNYPIAQAWLEDMLTTHLQIREPIVAIRFFMLGLFASGAISLDDWDEFYSLIAPKNTEEVH